MRISPVEIFGAGRLIGEHGGQQIVGAHALDRRRHLAAAARSAAPPAPARRSSASARRTSAQSSSACVSTCSTVAGFRKLKTSSSGKECCSLEREHDPVVGGRGLQFEIEGAAEALAQRQSPGAIDARAERRVDHQLHAAGFVEEALGDHGVLRRQRAQRALRRREHKRRPARRRGGRGRIRASSQLDGVGSPTISSRSRETSCDSSRVRPGRFAAPERNRRRRAVRILHAHAARLHAPDAPGSGAQQKTSPARLSTAKSSSSVPTIVPSGSATT